MPIAAVPGYLGRDFKDASPGLRFGLLLPIWTDRADQEKEVNSRAQAKSREGDEVQALLNQGMDRAIQQLRQRQPRPLPGLWEKNDSAAREAWKSIKALGKADVACMKALAERQRAAAQSVDHVARLEAISQAPFATGLGNEHPLENGFAFLNPYGLPYLPGSGVKGVLRQAVRELASSQWGDSKGWSTEKVYPLMQDEGDKRRPVIDDRTKQPVKLSLPDVLFGLESNDGNTVHVRGALSFWDVIPQIAGASLAVEIMTPHQSHYYQQKAVAGSTNPHDSGSPNPISFLTVPAGSAFTFHVVCDAAHLARLTRDRHEGAPDLLADGATHWQTLVRHAFEHAFAWLGFGGKTAVGYGAMAPASTEVAVTRNAAPRSRSASAAPVEWDKAKVVWDKGRQEIKAALQGKVTAPVKGLEAARALCADPAVFDRLIKKGELTNMQVAVTIDGNMIELKRVL